MISYEEETDTNPSKIIARKRSIDFDEGDSSDLGSNGGGGGGGSTNYHVNTPPTKRMHYSQSPGSSEMRAVSDHIKDMCNCQCNVCGKVRE